MMLPRLRECHKLPQAPHSPSSAGEQRTRGTKGRRGFLGDRALAWPLLA